MLSLSWKQPKQNTLQHTEDNVATSHEQRPLLNGTRTIESPTQRWIAPPGFIWIEIGIEFT
jgi:hypothetical protein